VIVVPVKDVNVPVVPTTVSPDTRELKVPVAKVAVTPETVPVTVKLPEVDANNPETVMLLSTPPLVNVIVSTLISPYGIFLNTFYDSSFLKLIFKE
jgi:hypothetical protein